VGEIIIVVIIKLPPTELDLKRNFKAFEFWVEFEFSQRRYRRSGGSKASTDQLWEQLPCPGQPRILGGGFHLGETRGCLPWK